jgi:hypothetical protein
LCRTGFDDNAIFDGPQFPDWIRISNVIGRKIGRVLRLAVTLVERE